MMLTRSRTRPLQLLILSVVLAAMLALTAMPAQAAVTILRRYQAANTNGHLKGPWVYNATTGAYVLQSEGYKENRVYFEQAFKQSIASTMSVRLSLCQEGTPYLWDRWELRDANGGLLAQGQNNDGGLCVQWSGTLSRDKAVFLRGFGYAPSSFFFVTAKTTQVTNGQLIQDWKLEVS